MQIATLIRAQAGAVPLLEQELAVAEDYVHRRAQLVAQVHDEGVDDGHDASAFP